MPISSTIHADIRLVIANVTGVMSRDDILSYQSEVWSREDTTGFDEIVDMSGVAKIEYESGQRVRELAEMSAGMDSPALASRLAIVAPDMGSFGLGRMYQTYRDMAPGSNKEVRVFKSMAEARAWLGK